MTVSSIGSSAWVRRFHPAPQAGTRLICFPHAGGSASYYFPVSRALSPTVDVLAIQYPGRQDRRTERCVEDIRELADLVVAELAEWTDRPIMLFGHSLGATLAFEVALRLQDRGVTPLGLFASGRRAPSCHRAESVHLSDDDHLVDTLKRMSGTDSRTLGDEEMLRLILPAVRSDYKAAETYRYQPSPRLRCPVVALIGDDDPEVTVDEARAWREHTSAEFAMKVFSGGHFYLNEHAAGVMSEITGHITLQGGGPR
jgi:pyochelin biosynthetic protein PchC